ncbi:hypothetical protein F2P81_006431 [Scophthalmus maximus]|uniref:Uncharacterized protein n=1 Tax=Scophthalmus maximus TaxID=52904 RepID=A0A6A4T369_SCOMX|nr:hypothetical protein F2P81_006431 [Scophthalmus maximus]
MKSAAGPAVTDVGRVTPSVPHKEEVRCTSRLLCDVSSREATGRTHIDAFHLHLPWLGERALNAPRARRVVSVSSAPVTERFPQPHSVGGSEHNPDGRHSYTTETSPRGCADRASFHFGLSNKRRLEPLQSLSESHGELVGEVQQQGRR